MDDLKLAKIKTPIGDMTSVADDDNLLLLMFEDQKNLKYEIQKIRNLTKKQIMVGKNDVIANLEKELELYFSGKLKSFKTPLSPFGTDFQKFVWSNMLNVTYGETKSYKNIAEGIEKPNSYRAVGNAVASNKILILIPCHRIIKNSGDISGYAGGTDRKQSLIKLEKINHFSTN